MKVLDYDGLSHLCTKIGTAITDLGNLTTQVGENTGNIESLQDMVEDATYGNMALGRKISTFENYLPTIAHNTETISTIADAFQVYSSCPPALTSVIDANTAAISTNTAAITDEQTERNGADYAVLKSLETLHPGFQWAYHVSRKAATVNSYARLASSALGNYGENSLLVFAPELDGTGITDFTNIYDGCTNLKDAGHIICNPNVQQQWGCPFQGCPADMRFKIEGLYGDMVLSNVSSHITDAVKEDLGYLVGHAAEGSYVGLPGVAITDAEAAEIAQLAGTTVSGIGRSFVDFDNGVSFDMSEE